MYVGITGTGHRLPTTVQRNEDLCVGIDLSPDWIESRTGITQRLIANSGECASEYARDASKGAIKQAGCSIRDIGLVIVATFSGDYVFPAAAVKLQSDLGIIGGHAFDVQANCSGFVTALTIASERMMFDSSIGYALVVGLEFCSRYTNSTDPETSVYLSDGAGAVIIGRVYQPGYIASSFWTDSSNYESVRLRGGGSSFRNPEAFNKSIFMEMNGLATWRQAITSLPKVIRDVCTKSGVQIEDIDMFIFHQANLRLIEYLIKKLKRDLGATYTNVERIGNTGAASISIALSEAVLEGKIRNQDLVCVAGVGAGFTFGASLWRWGSIVS